MKNIVLIGMRGSGKSTLGKALAKEHGLPFFDTDREIERTAGKPVAAIVAEDGWENFRALEAEVCAELAEQTGGMIATGGGVVLDERNIQSLRKNGLFVFLWFSLKDLEERIMADSSKRPTLIAGLSLTEELKQVWTERREKYFTAADLVWRGSEVRGLWEKIQEFI